MICLLSTAQTALVSSEIAPVDSLNIASGLLGTFALFATIWGLFVIGSFALVFAGFIAAAIALPLGVVGLRRSRRSAHVLPSRKWAKIGIIGASLVLGLWLAAILYLAIAGKQG